MSNIFKGLLNFIFNNKLKKECEMEIMETNNSVEQKKDFGFKIDRKKWKAAVEIVLTRRELKRAETEKKYWSAQDYYFDAELTKLYSIRAHARGRLHRREARLCEYEWRKLGHKEPGWKEFADHNGAIKFTLTLADQAAYIGDSWKEYEAIPKEIPVQE